MLVVLGLDLLAADEAVLAECARRLEDDARLRLLNASPDLGTVDLTSDKDELSRNVATLSLGEYGGRKAGVEAVTFADPRLEPITKRTYGICIYLGITATGWLKERVWSLGRWSKPIATVAWTRVAASSSPCGPTCARPTAATNTW